MLDFIEAFGGSIGRGADVGSENEVTPAVSAVPPNPVGLVVDDVLIKGSRLRLALRMHEDRRHFVLDNAQKKRFGRRDARYFLATPAGWSDAWEVFSAEDPDAARRIGSELRHRASRAAAEHQRRSSEMAARATQKHLREMEPQLAVIHECAVHSQYGIPGLRLGTVTTLYFLTNRALVQDSEGLRTFAQIGYQNVVNLVVDGPGRVTTGGGFYGGGFGVKGAVEGMLMATALNKLTARSTVTSFIEIQDADQHLVLVSEKETPAAIDLRLRPVFARVRAAQAAPRVPPGSDDLGDAHAQPALAEQLSKLSELHSSGALTDEEYAVAKAQILGL